MHEILNKVSQR